MVHPIIEKIQEYFQTIKINQFFYSEFIQSLFFIKEENNQITIGCSNRFVEDVLNSEWKSKLEGYLKGVVKLSFVASQSKSEICINKPPTNLNKSFTFENFFICEYNKKAVAAAKSLFGSVFWNPIYICGGVGLGKTHLLHAIGNEYVKLHPEKIVLYVSSDDFVREVYGCLSKNDGSVEKLKTKYESVDLLLFDDVEFLSKKDKINEILFFIFNKNKEENKIIVFTSDSTPSELNNFDNRMISRFSSGLCVVLQTPKENEIEKLFLEKIKKNNIHLEFNQESLNYITRRYNKDIRQLEGLIQNLVFWSINERKTDCVLVLDDVLKIINYLNIEKHKNNGYDVDPNIIINEICKFYNISPDLVKSKLKKKSCVKIRSICMHALRYKFNMPFEQIGAFFQKHHTTVIDAINNIENLIKKDNSLKTTLINLYKKI